MPRPWKALPPKTTTPPSSAVTWPLGIALLLIALIDCIVLTFKHFGAISLPGCGHGSACEEAAASIYGSVPGIGVPTSVVGLSYFAAALMGWAVCRGLPGPAMRWIIRLSALLSLGFLVVVGVEKLPCIYCLVIHGANLAFFLLVELVARRQATQSSRGLAGAGAMFVVLVAALGSYDHHEQTLAKAQAEALLRDSTRQMVTQAGNNNPDQPGKTGALPTQPGQTVAPRVTPPPPQKSGFSGRFRFGPEKAAVRIVMFTDYQCPDCFRIEGELKDLMSMNASLSVLIKSFPLSIQCNPNAPGDLHPNACWAARAAQTAGMIKGDAGFWQMHHWLFEHHGSFTDADFPPALTDLGYDASAFAALMQSSEPLARVKADVDEGLSLGIYYTPMIFINGVELKGWNAPSALTRAVNAVLAANPPPTTVASDHPPTALEKYMADWREQPVRQLAPLLTQRTMGPANAPVTVVLFGDYTEPGCIEADGLLRLFAAGPDPKLKYAFAHFPMDPACNPQVQRSLNSLSCACAKAAEGADLMAGPDEFWRMHGWLMATHGVFTDQSLNDQAAGASLDPRAFREAMAHPETLTRIRAQAEQAAALGITSIPMIFINGKYVPRWKLNNENLLPRMVDEAAAGAPVVAPTPPGTH